MEITTTKRQTLNSVFSIEVLRGVAVLLVAFLHGREVCWIGTQSYLHQMHFKVSLTGLLALITQPVVFGSIGVPIFFVLSGYCIHRKTAFKIAAATNPKYFKFSWGEFLVRRFIRIYPVLVGALLLTYLLDSRSITFPHINYKLGSLTGKSFLINLFALQGILGPTFGSNGALWSLSVEIQFYLFYPLLLLVRKFIGYNKTLAVIAVVNLISWLVFGQKIIFTSYYVSWYLGFYIAEIEANKVFEAVSKKLCLFIGIILILFGCGIFFTHNEKIFFNLWALGFAFYLWYILNRSYRVNYFSKILAFFGKISFSLYAVHLPIFVFLMSFFFDSQKPVSLIPAFSFLFIAVGLSWLFHELAERPAQKLLSGLRRPDPIELNYQDV